MYTRKTISVWTCVLLAAVAGVGGVASAQVVLSAEPQPGTEVTAAPSASTSSPGLYGTASSRSRSSGRRSRGRDTSADSYGLSIAMSGQTPSAGLASTVLLVPTGQSAREDLLALTEDLNIMCRVFDRLLEQAGLRGSDPRLISRYFRSGDEGRWLGQMFGEPSDRTECLYVEGYGPLFVMSVEFPLVPPPVEEPGAEPNEPTDPLWNQVRQETYAPQTARTVDRPDPRSEYSPVKVQQLKETLTRALKHAANIRAVDQSASLTVVVKGLRVSAPPSSGQWALGPQARWSLRADVVGEAAARPSATSMLTLRASMEDIRALASGQITDGGFRKRIELIQ